ncbi:chorion class CA protein ERA.2-like [Colias croceus]|uniref:chorion class CA protein ERA.2-like n=1 Tax=Colias crocea TaxID=72248 RepID=UPI001E27B083|nr:chorion class CA protein ERA.2-like [Colias croceus]
MSSKSFIVLCIQAFLVQNALSTIIGPAVYGNGFGLGNCAGAGLTAAAAEIAGWYGYNSPAQYPLEREIVEYAYPLDYYPRAREFVGPYGPIIEAPIGPFSGFGPYGYGPYEAIGAYGGEGIGDVSVFGEMPVAGTTLVNGQVPILGAVRFAGDLPAGGVVTIAGSCGCGCAY